MICVHKQYFSFSVGRLQAKKVVGSIFRALQGLLLWWCVGFVCSLIPQVVGWQS